MEAFFVKKIQKKLKKSIEIIYSLLYNVYVSI